MNTPRKTRVMLVDDHAVVRSGLRRMLEQRHQVEVVAEADSGEQAYQFYGECLPDVAVIDLSMPGMGGLEAVRRIITRYPEAVMLVFSMHENPAFASQALKAGARGYVAKAGAAEELVIAVQEVARGRTYISPVLAQKIAVQSLEGQNNPLGMLSLREFEVFRLFAEGRTHEEIGECLKISQKTVSNYFTLIKQKLGVSTPVEMLRIAMRHGVVGE